MNHQDHRHEPVGSACDEALAGRAASENVLAGWKVISIVGDGFSLPLAFPDPRGRIDTIFPMIKRNLGHTFYGKTYWGQVPRTAAARAHAQCQDPQTSAEEVLYGAVPRLSLPPSDAAYIKYDFFPSRKRMTAWRPALHRSYSFPTTLFIPFFLNIGPFRLKLLQYSLPLLIRDERSLRNQNGEGTQQLDDD
jgi:hypothetical protein